MQRLDSSDMVQQHPRQHCITDFLAPAPYVQSELASKKAMGGDMSGLAGFSAGAGTSEEHGLEAEITGG